MLATRSRLNPQLIAAIGSNSVGLLEPRQQCRATELGRAVAAVARRAFARRLGGRRRPDLNAGVAQAALGNPQAFAAIAANPSAFAGISQNAAALATLAANQKAFAALSRRSRTSRRLLANPSFSAALNQAGVSQSHSE